jgi:hypothetical protein
MPHPYNYSFPFCAAHKLEIVKIFRLIETPYPQDYFESSPSRSRTILISSKDDLISPFGKRICPRP